ncbi:MAG: TolC family protein [Lentimicrobiaceae bacterium]|nr:TolC family protein [Lentimicrobiaceae bacterium]MCB9024386.1 TolC family protein [Lentimicrobiaceae bacterium]
MRKIFAIILMMSVSLCFQLTVYGQSKTRQLSLQDVISIAQKQSPDALTTTHRFRSSYWQFRNYKAGLMPSLTFDATLPSLSRSIEKITTPDGDAFYERNQASYSAGLSLTKNIGLTGGQIFLNSDLQRIDLFSDSTRTSYLSSPLNIGLRQPIFNYNPYKWLKKTEPMRYSEAEKKYLEDIEQVSITASNLFFSLLDAQIRLKIQQTNMANNDTLYQIARGRFNIGTIAENELLQIELSLLNARSSVESANLDVEMKMFNLRSYLRIPEGEAIELIAPGAPAATTVDAQLAIAEARENRASMVAFERRLIEAESQVNKARTENRFNANLFAIYGLTQSTADFKEVYRNPQEQQRLEVGIQVPILDWGLTRGKIKLAESDRELVRTAVQQEQIDFEQEIFLKVMQFNMQRNQLAIAAKSDTVALKRYEVTKQRYLIGKIGIIDLNIAQTEKDNARQGYIASLAEYWRSYYELRKLTLYDFPAKRRITFSFDEIPDIQ